MRLKCKVSSICKIVLSTFVIVTSQAHATQRIEFSSGAAPDSYQAMVIHPVLTEAFRRIGYRFDVAYVPANRSAILSNSGKTDGELNRVSNFYQTTRGQFPNLLRIEPVLAEAKTAIFSHRRLAPCSVESMKNSTIAFKRGRRLTAKELTSKKYSFNEIVEVNTDEQALGMLVKGRVDYVQTGLHPGIKILQAQQAAQKYVPCLTRPTKQIHAYIHKKHQMLLPKLNQTLEKMKQDSTYQRLKAEAKKKFFSN